MSDEQKLSPEFKAKWVAALRGGEYRQGEGRLRDKENCFCCLGVALDLLGTDWVEHSSICYRTPSGAWGYLHDEELARIGISAAIHRRLADMNDDGLSFKKIANWIEAHL